MPFRLMSIFAHPDDETFGCAGAFQRTTTQGNVVAVVSATRGEEGQISDPTLATAANLGEVREQELRAACAAVGVQDVAFLDYIDGHLAEASQPEAIGRIVAQIRRFRPDVVLTFDENGMYGHVDHVAIHFLTLAAIQAAADAAQYPEQGAAHRVRKVYYSAAPRSFLLQMLQRDPTFTPGGDEATIPVTQMGTADDEITTRLVLTDAEYQAKMRAMLAHATQIGPENPIVGAPDAERRLFMGVENFKLAPPPFSDRVYPTPEEDLFAGL